MLPSFSVDRGMADSSYFLSGREGFFHRSADSGFATKWMGLWSRERKFLEYFAVQAGGEWLSPANCTRLDYDFASATHRYSTAHGAVRETLFMPEGTSSLVVSLQASRPTDFRIELAANIRKRIENVTGRRYDVSRSGAGVTVSNEIGSLSFRPLAGRASFHPEPLHRAHFPSGEEQSCFLPGKLSLSGGRVSFSLTTAPAGAKPKAAPLAASPGAKRARYESLVRDVLRTDNAALGKGFLSSALAMELLTRDFSGRECLYAGLPWFQQFWGRDLLWSLPALVDLARFEEAASCLRLFAPRSGTSPRLLSETEGEDRRGLDATMLWIIALEKYVLASGDSGLLRRLSPSLQKSLAYLAAREANGYLEHDLGEAETWTDTLRRGRHAVDIQALYLAALQSSSRLLSLLGRKPVPEERISSLRENIRRDFLSPPFPDSLPSGASGTANTLVPLALGVGESREFLEKLEPGLSTAKGIATRSPEAPGFDPAGYHTGMVWSLTTAWASAAEYLAGRPGRGWRYLETLLRNTGAEGVGCVGECWNAATLRPAGCSLQLWGSAFVVRLVDEFMLGIRPDAFGNTISVRPSLPPGTRGVERLVRLGGKSVRLSFRRSGSRMRVSCGSRSVKLVVDRE
jgi:glycogen debranching enzyme